MEVARSRAFIITGDPKFAQKAEQSRIEFKRYIDQLSKDLARPESKHLLKKVEESEKIHHEELLRVVKMRGVRFLKKGGYFQDNINSSVLEEELFQEEILPESLMFFDRMKRDIWTWRIWENLPTATTLILYKGNKIDLNNQLILSIIMPLILLY